MATKSMASLTFLLVVFAIGDFISQKTKAVVSVVLTSSIMLLFGYWMGLPQTIMSDAKIIEFGFLTVGLLITNMGTLMDFDQLKRQWRTVIIAFGAVIAAGIFVYCLGSFFVGKELAAAAGPIVAGGNAAALILLDVLKNKDLEKVAVFIVLILATQGFIGLPIASVMLKKEAKRIINDFKTNKLSRTKYIDSALTCEKETTILPKYNIFKPMPEELQTPFILLSKLCFVTLLSFKLSDLTNGLIHRLIMCLLLGVIAKEIGFVEENILEKSNSSGIILFLTTVVIFDNLKNSTPQMVIGLIKPLLICLVLGAVGVAIVATLIGKLLGVRPAMAIALGVTCMFGLPSSYIIPNEVSNAVAKNDEERKIILDELLPPMIIASFITVTIGSVIFAGIVAQTFQYL